MDEVALGLMLSDRDLTAKVLEARGGFPTRVVMEISLAGAVDEFFIDAELERTAPDVVFVEAGAAAERFPLLIRLLKNRTRPPVVVALLAEAQPESIMAAVRAGADDCFYPPLSAALLRQVLERAREERERRQPRRPPARTVGFLAAAGGCGATTVACHFAAELQRTYGASLLLADFDLKSGMINFWMRGAEGYSVRDAVRALPRMDASLWQGLVSTVKPQLDVLPAPAEVMMEEDCDAEHLLRVLRFARSHYDWVTADLGAGLTPASMRLLGEINRLVLVTTADVAALYQTRRILLKLLALDYPRDRVHLVVNRLHKHQQIRPDEIQKVLGGPIEMVLPEDVAGFEQAHAEGRLMSAKSELGKRISRLVVQTVGQLVSQPSEHKGELWPAFLSPARVRGM